MGDGFPGSLEEGRPAKLGILGGTFDPMHRGHLACALAAHRLLGLDGVLVVPAFMPVYKLDKWVTSPEDRLEMCRLAIGGRSFLAVSTLEVDRGGHTYTVDTLRQLRERYGTQAELYFITGPDAARTVPLWKDSDEIARLAHIVVASEVKGDDAPELARSGLDGRFACHYVPITGDDLAEAGCDGTEGELRSTNVRNLVRAGADVTGLVGPDVAAYIADHALYLE